MGKKIVLKSFRIASARRTVMRVYTFRLFGLVIVTHERSLLVVKMLFRDCRVENIP